MPSPTEEILCTYRYDALDRLTGLKPDIQNDLQRFYCNNRLATEIQGQGQFSIMQQGEQLLAQQHRVGGTVETDLLVTDQQRSVLKTLGSLPKPPIAYSPYGHRSAASGLTSLLGFNGERPDAITGRYLLGNGHRAFNPILMRFDSSDTLSPFGEGGLNAYVYCLGDPVNASDPTGATPWFKLATSELVGSGLMKSIISDPAVVMPSLVKGATSKTLKAEIQILKWTKKAFPRQRQPKTLKLSSVDSLDVKGYEAASRVPGLSDVKALDPFNIHFMQKAYRMNKFTDPGLQGLNRVKLENYYWHRDKVRSLLSDIKRSFEHLYLTEKPVTPYSVRNSSRHMAGGRKYKEWPYSSW